MHEIGSEEKLIGRRFLQLIGDLIDHLRNRLNFDLNKSRQKFHHSLKEHHKISNIPKFRCEML
jgi:hypothetical protein